MHTRGGMARWARDGGLSGAWRGIRRWISIRVCPHPFLERNGCRHHLRRHCAERGGQMARKRLHGRGTVGRRYRKGGNDAGPGRRRKGSSTIQSSHLLTSASQHPASRLVSTTASAPAKARMIRSDLRDRGISHIACHLKAAAAPASPAHRDRMGRVCPSRCNRVATADLNSGELPAAAAHPICCWQNCSEASIYSS